MTNNAHYRNARKWAHITGGTTVLRATGESAWLHKIVINTSAGVVLSIHNDGVGSGGLVYRTTLSTGNAFKKSIDFDFGLDNGLTVVLSAGGCDITVVYE